jgi:hypothetical protein
MQQTVSTVLTRAEPQQTSKGAIFKAWDQYGTEYVTFQQAIWEQARATLNAPVRVTYDSRSSKDGRFEDRYLESVELDGAMPSAQPAPALFPQAAQPTPTAQPFPAPTAGAQPASEFQRPKHPEEQRAIRRAVALNAAVATLPSLSIPVEHPDQVLAIAQNWEAWLAQ